STERELSCDAGHTFPVASGVPILVPPDESAEVAMQHLHQREFYDRVYEDPGGYRVELWQQSYVNRLSPLWVGGGDPFIDVGAGGDAYTVIEAAKAGMHAVGCDLSPEAMIRSKRLAAAEGVADRCEFVVCLAESLPFADRSFQSAASVHVLEHLPDDRAALRELARITRPGARVFIGVPNSFDHMPRLLRPIYRWHDRRIGHLRQYSPDDLVEKASAAGFRPLKTAISAHWVKVWQLAIHLPLQRLHIKDDRLWWWLERMDQRATSRPNGLHINLFLERS
ncbi:MAG TPA: class I SAM-dependent methyltransferase, partial [Candidatus Dormibacteraeota bacterium]|nr:class I SAM-dependent methyltransferase [Candidatus Dormibacteraeota bacterium]